MKQAIVALVGVLLLLPGAAAAQSAGGGAEAGRTAWGDPDLQGFWTNKTTTPMERPSEYGGRAALSDEERAELDARAASFVDRPPPPGSTGAYNSFWVERGTRSSQTSLVIDPPDGQLPELTDRVRERDAHVAASRNAAPDNYTDLNLYDRCITRGPAGLDDPRVLQPQLPDPADARPRRDPGRDDPRRAHRSAGGALARTVRRGAVAG